MNNDPGAGLGYEVQANAAVVRADVGGETQKVR